MRRKRTKPLQGTLSSTLFAESYLTNCRAWEKFNGRTKTMKGLFNYETAYRKHTRLCLEDFMKDNIQYAEIRPNFMTSNQLYHDDGTGPINNWGIMKIIIDEVERFQADMARGNKFFGGLKVIYCTPRSFSPKEVKVALDPSWFEQPCCRSRLSRFIFCWLRRRGLTS